MAVVSLSVSKGSRLRLCVQGASGVRSYRQSSKPQPLTALTTSCHASSQSSAYARNAIGSSASACSLWPAAAASLGFTLWRRLLHRHERLPLLHVSGSPYCSTTRGCCVCDDRRVGNGRYLVHDLNHSSYVEYVPGPVGTSCKLPISHRGHDLPDDRDNPTLLSLVVSRSPTDASLSSSAVNICKPWRGSIRVFAERSLQPMR